MKSTNLPIIVVSSQWGDEGKGKIVDYLAKDCDYVVRFNGGNNAGHTIVFRGIKFALSHLPCGVLWKKKLLISQGCVVNPEVLLKEIDFFSSKTEVDLVIDRRVNIVMPYHQMLDEATENHKGKNKVGSLKLGIGYCYEDRNNRHGIRLEDLVNKKIFSKRLYQEYELKKKRLFGVFGYKVKISPNEIINKYAVFGKKLKKYMGDVSEILGKNINKKKVLFEGAHGTFLDANFGTYPYTTAVNTISGSVFSYTGIPPQIMNVIGVVKSYTTRVGGGPFPCELRSETGAHLQSYGHEVGTVSKRPRRCGWLDLTMLRFACRLNGFSSLAITKLDVLTGLRQLKIALYHKIGNNKIYEFPSQLSDAEKAEPFYKSFYGWKQDISKIRSYKDLPLNARIYLQYIQDQLKIPIKYISVASERSAIIEKK